MSFAFTYNSEQKPPFVIVMTQQDKVGASWRPDATLCLTSALKTSGFLLAIAPEELASLLWLFSFLSPDGRLRASTHELSRALGVSPAKTRARFKRLSDARWLDQPIVFASDWGSGLDGFAPVPGFIPVIEEPQTAEFTPIIRVVPRETVIAHSRRTYARTRQEVEHEIATMMNWRREKAADGGGSTSPTRSPQEQQLHAELLRVGLLAEQADDLMQRYDAIRIRRQLAWLPHRNAKNPVGYLLSAIKENYAAPSALHSPSHSADEK